MQFWVGVTDRDWYDFLATEKPEEVNFWQPSQRSLARFLAPGVPFLFKLHSPDNFIVGGGFFVRFTSLPVYMAWSAFGRNNGVADTAEFVRRLARYRGDATTHSVIACNILAEPFFLPRSEWIPVPTDWKPNVVRGKTYDTAAETGRDLWSAVLLGLHRVRGASGPAIGDAPRFGAEYLVRARLGQGAFRILVADAYTRRCAITGERTLPALEAAHIKPYAEGGPHTTSNGLLLRSDVHKLFDENYMTVTPDLRIEVSRKIREEFENGREYYRYHGEPLQVVPGSSGDRPSNEFLRWHNDRFLG
jgi:putative restriction endonuclease